MGVFAGPEINEDGLVLALDAANLKSYDKYENLITYSEQLDEQSTWTDAGTTWSANSIIAPDGTQTADDPGFVSAKWGFYDVTNTSWISGYPQNYPFTVTSEWVRHSATITTPSGCTSLRFYPLRSSTDASYVYQPVTVTESTTYTASAYYKLAGDGTTVIAWGAQLERGSYVTDYYKTTSTAKTRGTTWTDLSGNGNNGTLTNGPTFDSGNGGSIVFDGSDDHVTFTSNPSLTDQITIEVWVKLNSTSASNGWICGRESSYRILYSSNAFGWVCATDNNGWYTTGTAIGAGSVAPHTNTYQVVVTYDGSNNKIYVNGTLRTTGSSISGNIKDLNPYYIMRDGSSDANIDYGKGNLYSHKLYNKALTASEIQQNFNALRGRFGI